GVERKTLGVLRIDATAVDVAGPRAESAAGVAPAETGLGAKGVVVAGKDSHIGAGIAAGEDLDHPADRVRPPQRRPWSAHDLDALDLADRQVLPGIAAGVCRRDADPVDQ